MTIRQCLFLLFFLCILLNGCMGLKSPSLNIEFYTLEYDFSEIKDLEKLDSTIKIRRFGSASAYNTNHMLYRTEPNRLASYTYHRWRTPPAAMITDRLFADFQTSGLFAGVIPYTSAVVSDFVMEGYVEEFCEWDDQGNWFARLSVSITLLTQDRERPGTIVFQKNYPQHVRSEKRTPEGIAKAMSRAMQIISNDIVADVYQTISLQQ